MAIFKQEIKSQKLSLTIWAGAIGFLLAITIYMYPEMKSQMGDISDVFASMGNFTEAFGMDRINFGTLTGYYAVEGCNILGLGGAFFAAITGVSALMKEERDRTAEFLLTHPVSRTKVVGEKLLGVIIVILLLNIFVFLCGVGSMAAIKEEIPWKEVILLHLAYLLLQFQIAGICFGISAFIGKTGFGIGIGVATILYFINILSNITEGAEKLKYITPFGYTEGADIITDLKLNMGYIVPGMVMMMVGIVIAFIKYGKKDIKA